MLFRVFLLLLVAFYTPSALSEYRIVTVDISKVLNESAASKLKRKSLDDLSREAKNRVEEKRGKLKAIEEKIKNGQIKEDSKEGEEFRKQARDFTRYVKDTEEDLKKTFLKENKALTDNALGVIKKYSEQQSIDLVLDRSQINGTSPVLFGSGSVDITDDIIKEMNKAGK